MKSKITSGTMQLYVGDNLKASIVYHDLTGSFSNRNKVIQSWKKDYLKKATEEAYIRMMPEDILMPSSDMLNKTIKEYKQVLREEDHKRYRQQLNAPQVAARPFS